MTQMSCNFREQSKIVRMGEKMSQTKPPPDVTPHPSQCLGECIWRVCHVGKPEPARITCQTEAPRTGAKIRGEGGEMCGLI